MAIGRLISIVLLLLASIGVMGLVSIHGELTAAAAAAEEKETIDSPVNSDDLVVIEAEMVPDGMQILLLPQVGDVLVKKRGEVEQLQGGYLLEDGKLYTWREGHRQRIWLFAAVGDNKPNVSYQP